MHIRCDFFLRNNLVIKYFIPKASTRIDFLKKFEQQNDNRMPMVVLCSDFANSEINIFPHHIVACETHKGFKDYIDQPDWEKWKDQHHYVLNTLI